MSSPNAKESYSWLDRLLIRLHRRMSHEHRIQVLGRILAPLVPEGASLLDLGCGDLRLANLLREMKHLHRCVGADIWPSRTPPPERCDYVQSDPDRPLPWIDGTFDVVLLVDVLHHCKDARSVLSEALRVGRRVIVKDHFEYGLVSRTLLQLMDFVGNFAYGVSLPERYFTPTRFSRLIVRAGAKSDASIRVGVRLYDHNPALARILSPDLHFIAELEAM